MTNLQQLALFLLATPFMIIVPAIWLAWILTLADDARPIAALLYFLAPFFALAAILFFIASQI